MGTILQYVLLVTIIQYCVCPPVTKKAVEGHPDDKENEVDHLEQMGIEYNRYLKQVVEALESDADFRRKLENAQEADIRSGKIAEELDYVNHHVRTKLDELKRQELDRLRNLAKMAVEKENNHDSPHLRPPEHLDHNNPNSFEIADLHKLIRKVTEDLEEADKKRRDEFKQYEMQKEFEQHEKLKTLDEEQKKKYQEQLEEMKRKHKKHEPLHHPGSKQQLEEVWEKQDHMGQQEFDPKTFFYLHDLDGNGFWDQDEVKALFLKELDKLYQAGVPESDMRERAEEMERMREHVFKESDTNRDGLISFEEFLQQTKRPEFEKDQGWESLDQQQPVYTPEEYAEFEKRRQEEIQRLIKAGRLPPHPPGMMVPPGHPGMGQQFQQPYMQQPQYGQQNSAYQQQQYAQPQMYGQQQYAQGQQPGVAGSYQVPPQGVPNQPQQGQFQQPPQGQFQQPQGQFHHPPQGQFQQPQQGQFQQPPQGQFQQPPQGQFQQPPQGQIQQPQQGQFQQPVAHPAPVGAQPVPPQHSGQQVPQPSGSNIPQQPVRQPINQVPLQNGQVPPQPAGQVPPQHIGQVPVHQPNAQIPQHPGAVPQQQVPLGSQERQPYDPNAIPVPQKQPVPIRGNVVPPASVVPDVQKNK